MAYNNNAIEAFPVNKKKIKKIVSYLEVGYVTYDNCLLFEKRPSRGLLANLDGLPAAENLKEYFLKKYHTEVTLGKPLNQKPIILPIKLGI